MGGLMKSMVKLSSAKPGTKSKPKQGMQSFSAPIRSNGPMLMPNNGAISQDYGNMGYIKKTPKSTMSRAMKKFKNRGLVDTGEAGTVLTKGSHHLKDLSLTWEDREHDWLAKQIREEARIMRTGDFLDLGAAHSAHCDAGDLKRSHHLMHMKGKNYG